MRKSAAIIVLLCLLLTSCGVGPATEAPAPSLTTPSERAAPLPVETQAPEPPKTEIVEDFWRGQWREVELTGPVDLSLILDGGDALPLLLTGDYSTAVDLRAVLEDSPGFLEKTSWLLTEPQEGEYLNCYRRMEGDGRRFELFFFGTAPDGGFERYVVVVTEETGSMQQVIRLSPRSGWVQDGSFALEDLNFDGIRDIKIFAGHYGASERDMGLIWDKSAGEYQESPSFEEIPNPIPDPEQKIVRGSWRINVSSHGWGIWECRDGIFTKTRSLTIGEQWDRSDPDDHTVWCEEETLVGGELQETARYDVTDPAEYERVTAPYYEPDSFWGVEERDYFRTT